MWYNDTTGKATKQRKINFGSPNFIMIKQTFFTTVLESIFQKLKFINHSESSSDALLLLGWAKRFGIFLI